MGEETLRSFIRKTVNEHATTKSPIAPGGGIILHRVGGLSFVKQDNESAPTKRGLWAFVWPYVEPFLLGSTNDRGVASQKDRDIDNTRYGQMKREGLRRFVYNGPLYVRHSLPNSIPVNDGEWNLVDADTYARWLSKHAAKSLSYLRRGASGSLGDEGHRVAHEYFPVGMNPFSKFSKDEWEVFVPANKGKITS